MKALTSDILPGHRLYTTLDGMRGVAALLVVSRHVTPLFGPSFRSSYLAVDLFFLLSGFVIANAYEGRILAGLQAKTFARIRAIRLYPIYALGVVVGIFASWLSSDVSANGLALHGILTTVLVPNPDSTGALFPINGPAWSLCLEVLINAVYVLLLRILVGTRLFVAMALCTAGLVVCLCLVPSHSLDIGWTIKTLPGGLLRVFFSFYAGVFLYRLHSRVGRSSCSQSFGNLVPLILIGASILLLTWRPPAPIVSVVDMLSVTCAFPAILWASLRHQPIGIIAKVFRVGGLASYAVYVLHAPLGTILTWVLTNHATSLNVDALVPWIGYAFLALLLPLCVAIDAFYDIPVRKFLTQYTGRRVRPKPDGAGSGFAADVNPATRGA